jgi:hypothetical protein
MSANVREERRRDHGHQKSYNAVDSRFHRANMRLRLARSQAHLAGMLA